MAHARRTHLAAAGILTTLALFATACGGDEATPASAGGDETTTPDDAGETTPAGDGETTADDGGSSDWDAIVEAAAEEGEVTVYTSGAPDLYEELGQGLQEEYGITLNIVRDIDSTLAQRIQAEQQAGNPTVDVLVQATPDVAALHKEEGWTTPVVGPAFDDPEYPDSMLGPNDTFEVASAILTLGWNTDLLPDGLEGYEDVLEQDLGSGQVGVIEPSAQSIVDFWVWMEETFGADYPEQLAELEPRIYPSSLPMAEALAAGEIAVGTFVPTTSLSTQKEAGAPVEYVVPDPVWGAHFYGQVFADAPHPNAAQVFANYLVSAEGQEIVARDIASAREGVESALTQNTVVRYIDTELLTDEYIREYQETWRELFQ